eukprot:9499795-Pyramimonas_sp.AAC.1
MWKKRCRGPSGQLRRDWRTRIPARINPRACPRRQSRQVSGDLQTTPRGPEKEPTRDRRQAQRARLMPPDRSHNTDARATSSYPQGGPGCPAPPWRSPGRQR